MMQEKLLPIALLIIFSGCISRTNKNTELLISDTCEVVRNTETDTPKETKYVTDFNSISGKDNSRTFFSVSDENNYICYSFKYLRIKNDNILDDRTTMDFRDNYTIDSVKNYNDSTLLIYLHIDLSLYKKILNAYDGDFNFKLNPKLERISGSYLWNIYFENGEYAGKYIDSMDVVKAGFVINDSYGGED